MTAEVYILPNANSRLSNLLPVAKFENESLQCAYRSIGVDDNRWIEWEVRKDSSEPLSSGYPMLSKLAWWFVDPVYFNQQDLQLLRQEIREISSKTNDLRILAFTDTLAYAVTKASQSKQILGVFP